MSTTITKARNRKSSASKDFRFDARLNEGQKLLIQRAADIEGRTMTEFVLHSAEAAAEYATRKSAKPPARVSADAPAEEQSA